MTFVRLFFIFIIGLFMRRLWRASKNKAPQSSSAFGSENRSTHASAGNKPTPGILSDITEQEIDDADFEEIP